MAVHTHTHTHTHIIKSWSVSRRHNHPRPPPAQVMPNAPRSSSRSATLMLQSPFRSAAAAPLTTPAGVHTFCTPKNPRISRTSAIATRPSPFTSPIHVAAGAGAGVGGGLAAGVPAAPPPPAAARQSAASEFCSSNQATKPSGKSRRQRANRSASTCSMLSLIVS